MAVFDELSDANRSAIAGKIGEWIATTPKFAEKRQATLELGESFQVWVLGLDQLKKTDQPLSDLAKNTARWHHQIRINGKTEAFARTIWINRPQPEWKMMQLSDAELTGKIDDQIGYLDKDENVEDDDLVRLLEIPAYHALTFWIQKRDQQSSLLIIDIPEMYGLSKGERLYSSEKFLKILSEKPAVAGVLMPPTNP